MVLWFEVIGKAFLNIFEVTTDPSLLVFTLSLKLLSSAVFFSLSLVGSFSSEVVSVSCQFNLWEVYFSLYVHSIG